jgi:hypothetical protein
MRTRSLLRLAVTLAQTVAILVPTGIGGPGCVGDSLQDRGDPGVQLDGGAGSGPTEIMVGGIAPLVIFPRGTISAPSAVFGFSIATASARDELYDLIPGTVPAPGWTATLVTDATGAAPLPLPWRVRIAKDAAVQVFVKVGIPAAAAGQTGFVDLEVISTTDPHAGFGFSRSPDFQVGQPAPPSPTLSFMASGMSGPGATVVSPEQFGFTIPTPADRIDRLTFSVGPLRPSSSYTMSLGWYGGDAAAANGWTVSTQGSPWVMTTPPSWPTTSLQITTGGGGGAFPTSVNLASVEAAGVARLVIAVTNDDPDRADDYGVYMPVVGPPRPLGVGAAALPARSFPATVPTE